MSTTAEQALVNPNLGMDNFIGELKAAGMDDAVKATQPEVIAPAEPEPVKEEPVKEPVKEVPKETPKEPVKETPKAEEEKKWPRTAKDWDAYKEADKKRLETERKEKEEIKAERDRIKSEIEELKKGGPSPELESLKKERDQLDEQLRLVSVQNHPKFKAYFENKTNAQIDLAKRIVGNDKGEQVAALLLAPDGPLKDQQLSDIVDTLTPLQQSRLGSVLNSLAQIDSERASEISKARENYDTVQKQQQQESETKRQNFTKMFDETVKSQVTSNPAFQKIDGNNAWNSEVDQRIETARNLLFGSPKPEIVAKAALDAVALPAVLRVSLEQSKEIESLKKQISELSSATPKVEAGKTTASSSSGPVKIPSHADPMSVVGTWMKGLQSAE